LPHAFVAALHVQVFNPRFAAPTRDILIADEVREFVREVVLATLPAQWAELRSKRTP
jgi:DNA gyrase/topoisomerase IV subunit B